MLSNTRSDDMITETITSQRYPAAVKWWLLLGVLMLIVQVVVGGITRLTGSGLSITEWDIISGTLPPLSESAWQAAFDLYKASPQYQEINQGMALGSVWQSGTFKFIYFWEWVHRLWARVMGIVFLVPFAYFWWTGRFDTMLKRKLICVFLLAGLAASFGWIMVASGLIDRPWVNAYKLALHLCIAFITYSVLLWTLYKTMLPDQHGRNFGLALRYGRLVTYFTGILWLQIFVGGVMSGMKAAVSYPTWPDLNGEWMPSVLLDGQVWTYQNFNYYDQHPFMAALVQVVHRGTAYVLVVLGVMLAWRLLRSNDKGLRVGSTVVVGLLTLQVTLGILTVVNSKQFIPVGYGVLHQLIALLLLSATLYLNFLVYRPKV